MYDIHNNMYINIFTEIVVNVITIYAMGGRKDRIYYTVQPCHQSECCQKRRSAIREYRGAEQM